MNGDDLDHPEVGRRDFINIAALSFCGVGATAAVIPLIESMSPSADVLAVSTTEIDISNIEVGQAIKAVYRNQPLFVRGGLVGLNRDRRSISGSSAGCFLELPIWGVMQGGRSPTGMTPHIGGQIHAAIASGRLSKYVWSGVLAARLECGLLAL